MILRLYYQGPFYSRIDKDQVVAYPIAGVLVTLADYAMFALCFTLLGTGLLAATVVAYIFGLVVSYLLNRFWVFRKGANKQSEASSLVRYGIFLAANLAITYAILWWLQDWLGLTPYIGKLVVGAFMFFWIYIGNKYFVFKGRNTGPIKL